MSLVALVSKYSPHAALKSDNGHGLHLELPEATIRALREAWELEADADIRVHVRVRRQSASQPQPQYVVSLGGSWTLRPRRRRGENVLSLRLVEKQISGLASIKPYSLSECEARLEESELVIEQPVKPRQPIRMDRKVRVEKPTRAGKAAPSAPSTAPRTEVVTVTIMDRVYEYKVPLDQALDLVLELGQGQQQQE